MVHLNTCVKNLNIEDKLLRRTFLVFAFGNLITGLISGLARLGWHMPLPETYLHHGAIMVGGFLGSLISLEKVVPLKRPVFYAGPLLSASSISAFLYGENRMAIAMLFFASAVLVIVHGIYLKKQFTLFQVFAIIGAFCWCVGNLLFLWKQFYPLVFPWWMGFVLFTIVGERLELSKFLPVTDKHKLILVALMCAFLIGLVLPFHRVGKYVVGTSLIVVAMWLLRYDVVKLTVKKVGLVRFTAVALIFGYACLLLEGVFLITLQDASFNYDIVVHTFFLGFVFPMIFAHGPMILPGVLGLTVRPYSALFYFPLIALAVSLAMRIASNAAILPFQYKAISGWISASSILTYFILMVGILVVTLRHAKVG